MPSSLFIPEHVAAQAAGLHGLRYITRRASARGRGSRLLLPGSIVLQGCRDGALRLEPPIGVVSAANINVVSGYLFAV